MDHKRLALLNRRNATHVKCRQMKKRYIDLAVSHERLAQIETRSTAPTDTHTYNSLINTIRE